VVVFSGGLENLAGESGLVFNVGNARTNGPPTSPPPTPRSSDPLPFHTYVPCSIVPVLPFTLFNRTQHPLKTPPPEPLNCNRLGLGIKNTTLPHLQTR